MIGVLEATAIAQSSIKYSETEPVNLGIDRSLISKGYKSWKQDSFELFAHAWLITISAVNHGNGFRLNDAILTKYSYEGTFPTWPGDQ